MLNQRRHAVSATLRRCALKRWQRKIRGFTMIKVGMLYLVGCFASLYSLYMLSYAVASGSIWSAVWDLILFAGGVGCFLKKRWAQYPIYVFSTGAVISWVWYTASYICSKGWPYYSTTFESIIGLMPGILLCIFFILSTVIVYKFFRSQN